MISRLLTYIFDRGHSWRLPVALAIFAGALFLPALGIRDISTADEGQRAVPPMEMLRTGDWMVPRLNGVEYLKKPPLLYWQVAGFYKVFGVREWSARLPCALMGIGLVLLTFYWAARFMERRAAGLAGVFCAANYLVLVKSRECQLDICMALCTLAALIFWWKALEILDGNEAETHGPPGAKKGSPPGFASHVFGGAACLALAHLYKFPVPFLFLAASWAGCITANRKWRYFAKWHWWAGLLASLIPLGLWACAAAQSVGWERARDIWFREAALHVHRASSINSGPPWFYAIRIVACMAPWCVWLPWLFRNSFWAAQKERRMAFNYLWTGTAISLVFLSLNTAKETEYMLCLFPPLAILMAMAAEHAAGMNSLAKEDCEAGKDRAAQAPRLLIPGFIRSRLRGCFAAGCLLYLGIAWILLPLHETYLNRRRTLREAARVVREHIDKGGRAATYSLDLRPQIYFYVARPLEMIAGKKELLDDYLRAHPGDLIIMPGKAWKRLQTGTNSQSGANPRSGANSSPLKEIIRSGPSSDYVVAGIPPGAPTVPTAPSETQPTGP